MAADNNRHQFNAREAIAQRLIRRVFLDGEDVTERCAVVSIVSDEPLPVAEAEGIVTLVKIVRDDPAMLGVSTERRRGKVRIEFDIGGKET